MAAYRQVFVSFWQDAFVLDLTPEEKYFYVYLMTNGKTSQCGIYELPQRVIEMDTGYNRETVEKLIERFISYGKILYCKKTKEIMILNWLKYNLVNSPKVKSCMTKELLEVKNKDFIKKLVEVVKDQKLMEELRWIPYLEYQEPIETPTVEATSILSAETTSIPTVDAVATTPVHAIAAYSKNVMATPCEAAISIPLGDTVPAPNIYTISTLNPSYENPIDTLSIPKEYPMNTMSLDYGEEREREEEIEIEVEEEREREGEKEKEADTLSHSLIKHFEDLTGKIGGLNYNSIKLTVAIHGYANVKKAIDRALEVNKPNMNYINGILRNWAKEGYPKEGERVKNGSSVSSRFKNTTEYRGFKPQEPRQFSDEERREIEADLI